MCLVSNNFVLTLIIQKGGPSVFLAKILRGLLLHQFDAVITINFCAATYIIHVASNSLSITVFNTSLM
jgi:hypothetical protein